MSSDARRKEKQRLKREKKKAQMRREMSGSPYKRIGQAGPVEACYINSDWKQSGLASIQVVRHNPAGGHAMACFLIDVWCAGLKDAWGRIDLMKEDIDRNLKRARENFELERIDVEVVRQLVAGSIRFAQQNGFRLPDHYDRWINLLGGVGEVSAAPLADFGKDGKLCWIGPIDDLRRRLIGCTPEQFMNRPDVEFTAGFEDESEFEPVDEDDDDEEFEAQVAILRRRARGLAQNKAREVRDHCARQGVMPRDELDDAAKFVQGMLMLACALEARREGDDDSANLVQCAAEDLLSEVEPGLATRDSAIMPDRLHPALKQINAMLNNPGVSMAELLDPPESRQTTDSAL